ncbi:MAG: YcaQ family DNA glycosylase [Candidatus Bipolaricaulota bacterium]|nr:MAG: YcaQ family DNA glycosylase [Candidatus Bipolaricaulota bacterium]
MASDVTWSIEQARLYQLAAVGLHGAAYPPGDEGIRRCFRDLSCLQLDPLPVLGRNHDLVIQARVPETHPGEALDLIHRERLGFEYWDKMLCAVAIEWFPLLRSLMERSGDAWIRRRGEQLERDAQGTLAAETGAVREHGPTSSRDLAALGVAQRDHRGWKSTKAANVALEALWNSGVLSVSHRRNFRRYFDLAERIIPETLRNEAPPSPEEYSRKALLKRVRTVGLLPARGSPDAWTALRDARRQQVAARLVGEGHLEEIRVDGVRTPYFAASDASERLSRLEGSDDDRGVRFIAPLDPLMWARDSLRQLWAFDYVWEVYKPAAKRTYGYYVLPVLKDRRFVARFDGRFDREEATLRVLSYHPEPDGVPVDDPEVRAAFARFLRYLGGAQIEFPAGERWAPDLSGEGH